MEETYRLPEYITSILRDLIFMLCGTVARKWPTQAQGKIYASRSGKYRRFIRRKIKIEILHLKQNKKQILMTMTEFLSF